MKKTLQDILQLCKEKEIRIVDFKMTDIDGRWRHLSIPVGRLNEDTMTYGVGFDGSNYGYAPVESSDMVFVPDLDSATVDQFAAISTLSMIGDVMVIDRPQNRPFDQYPRNVARRAVEYLKETGIADTMVVGPEYEFYVFDGVQYENRPESAGYHIDCVQAEGNSGNPANNIEYHVLHHAGYHTSLPLDVTNDLRSQITLDLEDWGVKVKYHHHEVGGPGQLEIEVEFDELASQADKTMLAKYVIKNEDIREGHTATFLPKPVYNEAGSGMHVHMILFKDGKPLFYDPSGYSELSKTAMNFIGGLLRHIGALCAITDPTTNSYKRLLPGFEAPVTVGFATANRSAVIRIPAYAKSPDKRRFEIRNVDGTCNPYYAYAAILMAGLDGIKNEIDPVAEGHGPYDFNLYELSDEEKAKIASLPKSLDEALDALEKDHDFLTEGGVFPQRLIDLWIAGKRAEIERINKVPTPMEFQMYYDL